MGFLVACKNEEDPIKTEVINGILPKFKLIQALIVVLIVCKNEEDPFKIETPIISLLGFLQTLKGR